MVPINTPLTSGDRIEILTSNSTNLSYNWLNFVKTSKAKTRIRRWLNHNEFEQSIKLGKEILEKGLRRLKMAERLKMANEEGWKKMGYQTQDLYYQAIGKGDLTLRAIIEKLFPVEDVSEEKIDESTSFSNLLKPFRRRPEGVKIQGIENLMVQFGKCCNPIPGDEIVGFITRGRGVTIHRSRSPHHHIGSAALMGREFGQVVDGARSHRQVNPLLRLGGRRSLWCLRLAPGWPWS